MVDSERTDESGDETVVEMEQERAAELRDQAGRRRDVAAQLRDEAAVGRDLAADLRDQAADGRDRGSHAADAPVGPSSAPAAAPNLAGARRAAAADRERALRDRGAGASDRVDAELDRASAMADRGASAGDRLQASTDGLTGVYTREAGLLELERDLARVRRTGDPLVLAFVDVDHLKLTNDARGHAAGDRLLRGVAETLRAALRDYDLIIRYGGDEFVCALSGLNMADATKRLAFVNASLAEANEHGSVTVGLAELRPGDSPEDLVARADAALYRQRRQQRRTGA